MQKNAQERVAIIYVTVLGVVVIGAWLRFRNLSLDSVWLDEACSWLESKGSLASLISATAQDNYPPLHNLLLYAFMNVSGTDSEWLLRAPSALLGIGNIVAIYWLGTLIGGRIAGVLAATVLATSSFHIYYSQEARMYTLLALAATLYAAAAFFFIKSPTHARAASLTVFGLALVYSHPFGALNWIAIAIGISISMAASDFPRRGFFPWIIANAAIAIGFLPWAVILLDRARVIGDFWPPYPSYDVIYEQLSSLIGGGRRVAVLLLVGVAVAVRSNFRDSAVLICWAVVPVVLALIESLVSTHIFFARYFIGTLPALFTLFALGVAHLLSRLRWPTAVAATLILGAVIIGHLRYPRLHHDDWRTTAAYVRERVQVSDCVLVYPFFDITPLRYYLRTHSCIIPLSSLAEINDKKIATARTFAVLDRGFVSDAEIDSVQATMSNEGREAERFEAFVITTIESRRVRETAQSEPP
jgi:4-amino-4-deoxy-L-arabinose transferase-like glycosyltransferase